VKAAGAPEQNQVSLIHRVLVAATLVTLAWGALAFGGVYAWAYTPLAIGCALLGLVSIAGLRTRVPMTSMGLGLAAIAAAVALQLVPLPSTRLARISPSTDAFLAHQDFSYRIDKAGRDAEGPTLAGALPPGRPLSLAPRQTGLGLLLFGALALFLLGTTKLLSNAGAASAARGIVCIGAMIALIGLIQYTLLGNSEREPIKVYGFWTPRYKATSFGPFINRNHFAGWMLMALPLAIGGAYAAASAVPRSTRAGWREYFAWLSTRSAAGMLLMIFAAALMGTSLMLSESRSGMAALAAGCVAFAWVVVRRQESRRAKLVTAGWFAAVALAVVAWAGAEVLVRRVSSLEKDMSSIGGRRQAWADTLGIMRDFPLAGTGLNTYGTAMMQYASTRGPLHFQEAHNDYLQLAAEGGLLVGVPVLATLVLFVGAVRRRFGEAPHSGSTYWIRVGAVTGLVAIACQSTFEFSLQMPGNAAMFAFLAAVALHRSPSLRSPRPRLGSDVGLTPATAGSQDIAHDQATSPNE
jgi:O-antigen ligase